MCVAGLSILLLSQSVCLRRLSKEVVRTITPVAGDEWVPESTSFDVPVQQDKDSTLPRTSAGSPPPLLDQRVSRGHVSGQTLR